MGFFVDRPVFATVIALILTLIGAIASTQLAVEQYPNVAPPQVKVSAVYPGPPAPRSSRTPSPRRSSAR
jgi:multidrug efflux pump